MSDQPVNKAHPTDLSGAFGGAKLGGLRPVARRAQQAPAQADAGEQAPADEPARAARPARSGPRPGARARSAHPHAKREFTVWLSGETRDELRKRSKALEGGTHGQVVLEAVKATHKDLPQLVQDDLAGRVVTGDLWDEIVPAASTTGSRFQLKLSVTQQQLDVIDRLVQECGADSRSHLLGLALDHFFGEDS